jgi:3-oxoacyl-[acyl-carrier-protein] synthase-3
MKRPLVELGGTGRYVPSKVLTNEDFERMVDTSDEWIQERTGIRERHIAESHETVAFMSKVACEQALAESGLTVKDVDAIILGTSSPDRYLPSNGCDVQAQLGATNAAAFDVGAACSSFLYGLTVAEGMISTGAARHVLVIGAERMSTIIDYTDRATAVLFGDGAGAALVRASSNGQRGILSNYLKSDGSLGDLLYRPGGGGNHPPDENLLAEHGFFVKMAGREVFRNAVRSMADACDRALEQAGIQGKDIDVLIPHQANIRIIEATAKHASISMEKVYVNVDRYGNTSAASVPIALDECVRCGRIKPGSLVLLVAFGGGFTWASTVLQW